MRKPLGGLVSSLAFVLACEDSTGPQQATSAKIDPSGSGANGSCPQIVQFDRETGRITILDPELSNQLRAYYGVQPGAAGRAKRWSCSSVRRRRRATPATRSTPAIRS